MVKQNNAPVIYQIKVTLKETDPVIWRRILVPSNITLHRLHLILQEGMGWTNSHLYRFMIDKNEYSIPDPENDFDEIDCIDSRKTKLDFVVTAKGDKFSYEYDFGDGWMHKLLVEDISEPVDGNSYPVCVKGERNCPPEDCGGPYGFTRLLGIIANPDNAEYKEMIEWLGNGYEPAFFSAEKVNRRLKPIQRR